MRISDWSKHAAFGCYFLSLDCYFCRQMAKEGYNWADDVQYWTLPGRCWYPSQFGEIHFWTSCCLRRIISRIQAEGGDLRSLFHDIYDIKLIVVDIETSLLLGIHWPIVCFTLEQVSFLPFIKLSRQWIIRKWLHYVTQGNFIAVTLFLMLVCWELVWIVTASFCLCPGYNKGFDLELSTSRGDQPLDLWFAENVGLISGSAADLRPSRKLWRWLSNAKFTRG